MEKTALAAAPATADSPGMTAESIPSADVQLQLEKMLLSRLFTSSPRLSRFLRYTVEQALCGQQSKLKEYILGLEVFERPDSFDPRIDSIVRVEASRLRAKVREYYQGEGYDDEVIIRFQKGDYTPQFLRRRKLGDPAPSPDRVATWEWNIATDELNCSEELGPMLGMNHGARLTLDKLFFDHTSAEDLERVKSALARSATRMQDMDISFRVGQNGTMKRTLRVRGQVTCNTEGRPTKVAGICLDVSPEVHAITMEEANKIVEGPWRDLSENVQRLLEYCKGNPEAEALVEKLQEDTKQVDTMLQSMATMRVA